MTGVYSRWAPLDGDADRLSFGYAVLNALDMTEQSDSGDLAHLKRAANSMKVTFVYCRSQKEVERLKWQLSSRVSVLNETQVRGCKRALGIVQVSKHLSSWPLQADADAPTCFILLMLHVCSLTSGAGLFFCGTT